MKKLLYILCFSVIISGCASIPTTIVTSTSPLPPGIKGTIKAKGTNCQYFLLGLIPVTSSPDSQDALDAAKENADVDVLTDVTVDHNSGYYILFSNRCVKIRGLGVPRDVLKNHFNRESTIQSNTINKSMEAVQ